MKEETFLEILWELMYILWLFAITVLMIIAFPIWIIPYTAYKIWKWNST